MAVKCNLPLDCHFFATGIQTDRKISTRDEFCLVSRTMVEWSQYDVLFPFGDYSPFVVRAMGFSHTSPGFGKSD